MKSNQGAHCDRIRGGSFRHGCFFILLLLLFCGKEDSNFTYDLRIDLRTLGSVLVSTKTTKEGRRRHDSKLDTNLDFLSSCIVSSINQNGGELW